MEELRNTALPPQQLQRQHEEAQAAQSELAVSLKDYRESIEVLWTRAMGGDQTDPSAQAAAMVLLACHETNRWGGLMLKDLCSLDYRLLKAGFTVLRGGRLVQGLEPHTLIPNGSERFKGLASKWGGYLSLDS